MVDVYATPEQVRAFTGLRPDDLGVDSDEALDKLLKEWGAHVRALIDAAAHHDFGDGKDAVDEVPAAVRSVALRATANYVALAQSARESKFVRIDEWRVGLEQHDMVLTPALRRDLPAPRGRKAVRGFVAHGGDS